MNKTGINQFLEKKGCDPGYNVGDRGNTLSPGEMQRISLGRAMLKKPDVLIMDEPTNNLDEQTIKIIWQVIFEYARDHIVLVISHSHPPALGRVNLFRLENGKLQAMDNDTTKN